MAAEVESREGSRRLTVLRDLFESNEDRSKKASSKYGKSLRRAVPRDVLAAWHLPVGRPDVADLIFSRDASCAPELRELRHERMAASPFAFYCGGASQMAFDLTPLPTTGIETQVLGDAHIANFGVYLSPERRYVVDFNDFDETTRGPWEWDVARLAASVEILGRDRGFSFKKRAAAVLAALRAYRTWTRRFAEMGHLDVWYWHPDVELILEDFDATGGARKRRNQVSDLVRPKHKRSGKHFGRVARDLTDVEGGSLCLRDAAPEIVPLTDLVAEEGAPVPADFEEAQLVSQVLSLFLRTLPPDCVRLLARYQGTDIARKVVATGSAGTRCWLVALEGADTQDPLVLQVKEATTSVLERFVGKAPQRNHGQRVVEGQHAMQTILDSFLGWTSLPGEDGHIHDYYVRQVVDDTISYDLSKVDASGLERVAFACGATLAHAHSRSGDRFAIASYLGKADTFDQAGLAFARLYADQNEQDWRAFCERVKAQDLA